MLTIGLGSAWPGLVRWTGTQSPTDQLMSGQLAADGMPVARGAPLAANVHMQTERGAVVALAHAEVQLTAGARADWNAGARILRLHSGSLLAEVDPARKQSFTVETDRLRVSVLGTRFEVEPTSVKVLHGRVQVSAKDGHELAVLHAGERYDLPPTAAPAVSREPVRAIAPVSTSDSTATTAVPTLPTQRDARTSTERPVARSAATNRSSDPAQPRQDVVPAARLLDRARTELAAQKVAAARALLDTLLQARPVPAERAEALSLRADCFLVEHDPGAAAQAYRQVAEEFAQLPAGENALFAAARLEAEHGEQAAAHNLFERYLARYPHGRFIKEVNARLAHSSSPVPVR
jgi:TolA-binding protein